MRNYSLQKLPEIFNAKKILNILPNNTQELSQNDDSFHMLQKATVYFLCCNKYMFQNEFVASQDCDRDHLGSVFTSNIRMSFSGAYRFK